jgi:hypothetical protein
VERKSQNVRDRMAEMQNASKIAAEKIGKK